MDALALLRAVASYRDAQTPASPRPRLATIDPAYTTGLPKVTFDGESTLSTKRYPRLASYVPVAGDRVLMIPISASYVIIGKVSTS